jgi:omega-6 fatty acid desaturase (delta-12 desaturase)
LTLTLATYYLAEKYIPLTIWALPLWIAYAFICGTIATGLWVLGHECGHQAFSDSKLLNDTLGFIIHTALLVPYFSW